MADQKIYAAGKVYLDGSEWLESVDLTISRKGNHLAQRTNATGLSGFKVGAGEIEVTGTNAVPADGFEWANPDLFTAKTHKLTVLVGAQSITVSGVFMDDSLSLGAEKLTEQGFTFLGSPAEFQ
jgi:hypothetical protein